jgi:two-component system, NarL family, nitrate/nitrite response regulator NarL
MEITTQACGQPLKDEAAEPKLLDLNACKLSAKETQVLKSLEDGTPNKIIACKLKIPETDVKTHVQGDVTITSGQGLMA